jgi:hypothetical protein
VEKNFGIFTNSTGQIDPIEFAKMRRSSGSSLVPSVKVNIIRLDIKGLVIELCDARIDGD